MEASERGRKTPELKTLERLVGAMGYPLAAVDRVRSFILALRSESQVLGPALVPPGREVSPQPDTAAALQWEADQVCAEIGRAVSRMTRLMFALAGRGRGASQGTDPRQARDEPPSKETKAATDR